MNVDADKRFSPSKCIQLLLNQIDRVHKYQFHKDFSFVDLTEINITQKRVSEIRQMIIDEEPDLSDLVLKIVELAVSDGKFNSFVKHYLAEEFEVDPSFSFLILCVLTVE